MKRLGYTRYVAQGGDWGAIITDLMGVQAPPELLGIHTNMAGAVPPDIDQGPRCRRAAAAASRLSRPRRSAPYEQLGFFYQHVSYASSWGRARRR